MAKGHAFLGPRWVYLPDDPDVEVDVDVYRESMYREGITASDGATSFQITPLTPRQKRLALANDFDVDIVLRCGLVRVKGFVLENEDGTFAEFKQPDRKDRHGGMGVSASQEWADDCPIHWRDKNALAAMIFQVSEPDPLSLRPSELPSGGSSKSETESMEQSK